MKGMGNSHKEAQNSQKDLWAFCEFSWLISLFFLAQNVRN